MRDIQQVLERFGAWAANNREDVTWSTVAAGFKGLIPSKVTSRPQCCDDDAMVISGCMARLHRSNADMHDLLVDYYVFGMTLRVTGSISLDGIKATPESRGIYRWLPLGAGRHSRNGSLCAARASGRGVGDELNNLRVTFSPAQKNPTKNAKWSDRWSEKKRQKNQL